MPRELVVVALRPEDSAAVARRRLKPLIRLDCFGAARPGAAESWTSDSSHRSWTFVLAPSVSGLTAAGVAAEWRSRPDAATTLRYAGVSAIIPLDQRRLVITLDRPADSVPVFFADSTLGLVSDSLSATGSAFAFRPADSGDPRDALDAGADILRSGDPKLLEYARARSDFTVHPLPWSRTYVLVLPPGGDELGALISADSAGFRAGLARDAVRADARGAEPPFWWDRMGPCPGSSSLPPAPGVPGVNSVVYPAEDTVARALAERVVALSERPLTATSHQPGYRMSEALHQGLPHAYIVSLPRIALVPCREIAEWPEGSTLVPLIDTRMSAIVRRGVPRLTAEFDGSLRPVEAP